MWPAARCRRGGDGGGGGRICQPRRRPESLALTSTGRAKTRLLTTGPRTRSSAETCLQPTNSPTSCHITGSHGPHRSCRLAAKVANVDRQQITLGMPKYLRSNIGATATWDRPVGHVPSNTGDHGDQVHLVPSNFCNWLPFFLRAMWEADPLNLGPRAEGKRNRKRKGFNIHPT